MKSDDIQNLLGGFATDTLTDRERELLFTAALKDQELFNALADDQALRELLSDPASRRQLLEAVQPQKRGIFDWLRRPLFWAGAVSAMMALVATVAIRQAHPPLIQIAQNLEPKPVEKVVEQRESPSVPQPAKVEAARKRSFEKMKVVVLDFDSGPAVAKESDVGKTASALLGKKLDSGGYTVIDRKHVDQALLSQNLNTRRLDSSAAASLGRSLGADAVIVGSVKKAQQAPAGISSQLQVSATAINTQTSSNFAEAASQGRQSTEPVLVDAVNQVASSLGQQIQQNARIKIVGLITDVSRDNITIDAGSKTGVKVGDRFEVRRDGKAIGRTIIQTVKDSSSVGAYQGAIEARIGDTAANQ